MADHLGDGNVKVTWLDELSDIHNPPASELNAGVDLQEVLTKDGLDINPEQAAVDNTNLASRAETEDAGTVKFNVELKVKIQEDEEDDIGTNTLTDRKKGHLAVRRNRPHEEPYEEGDKVEIYPSRCGIQRVQPPAINTPQTFNIKLFNYTAADPKAVVA